MSILEISTPPSSGSAAANEAIIARDLYHTFYRDQVPVNALNGINLTLPQGCQVAIMGPSGCGKSTLLHVLAGLIHPTQGQVLHGGADLTAMGLEESSRLRLQRFGFVFQDGQLLPELSNEENVALPLMLNGTTKGKAVRFARDLLSQFGLDGLGRYRPGQLSGGQAQRVAIARATITNPRVIFADEPTGALDQSTGKEVMSVLTRVCSSRRTSLVLVTHDEGVAHTLPHTIHLRDGKIIDLKGRP